MCGIWALFGSNVDVKKQSVNSMTIAHRGPDAWRVENPSGFGGSCCLAFYRLAIMDDLHGMQPMRLMHLPHIYLVYNGEIYNHKIVGDQFGFEYTTTCDAESIIHLYNKGGIDFCCSNLDGIYAFCILDTQAKKVFLARDTYGVRPAFRFLTEDGCLGICSELKGLVNIETDQAFKTTACKPGHYEEFDLADDGKASFVKQEKFHGVGEMPAYKTVFRPEGDDVSCNIRHLLNESVKKRLMSERRVGCLLSGGLDSSLVASLLVKNATEAKIPYKIQTFSIGMEGSPDIIAARMVANHIGSEHHELTFTPEEGIAAVKDIVYATESYDIITVRGAIGLYLICKYIREKTDAVVIFSGEGADEVAMGYIYFHNSPSPKDSDQESRRLLKDLYLFDVLRGDRTTSYHGLELRVPYLDHSFVSYYLSLDPELRKPKDGVEKHLLRSAFDGTGILPQENLWRPKEAFNDGMSPYKKSWPEYLKEYIDTQVTDSMMSEASKEFSFNPPKTKEAYYYRQIFESHFPGRSEIIPYFWMPRWSGDTTDPSARLLKTYKKSMDQTV